MSGIVRFYFSLSSNWKTKVIDIGGAKDQGNTPLDNIVGSLATQKMNKANRNQEAPIRENEFPSYPMVHHFMKMK